MLKIRKLSEVLGKTVYTSDGELFGQIEEVNLVDNKIEGWRIKLGSGFMSALGGARGVVVPHQFVKAVGDVFIMNKASLPSKDDGNMGAIDLSEAPASSGADSDNLV